MTVEPRAALTTLISAFERHLEACASRRGEDDPTVVAAADDLADAFDTYDEALLGAYGEMTPLEVYGSDEDDFDDEDADGIAAEDELDDHDTDDGEDEVYSGFDGDAYDDVDRDNG